MPLLSLCQGLLTYLRTYVLTYLRTYLLTYLLATLGDAAALALPGQRRRAALLRADHLFDWQADGRWIPVNAALRGRRQAAK